jgi:hypothetical protein
MEEVLLTVKGRNGQLELLNDRVRICRQGSLALLLQGAKGNKDIFYSDITSVQFKLPGMMVGYIQFTFSGGMESKKGVFDATADENTVTFTPAHKKDFEFAKGEIDRRIAHAKKGSVGQAAGLLELEKLASLKDKGILNLEEFAAKKQQILEGNDTLDATAVRAYRDALEKKWQAHAQRVNLLWNIAGCLVGGFIIVMAPSALPKHPLLAISYALVGLIPTPVLTMVTERMGGYKPGFWMRSLLCIIGFIVFGMLFGK